MSINSDYSLWFILPCLLASYFAAVYLYSKNEWFKQQSKSIRLLLKALRTSVLFILFLLLIGLIFQHTSYRKEKPVLITLVDNSASMLSYNDSAQIQKQISALQAKIKTKFSDKFELVTYSIGSEFKEKNIFKFSEQTSALEKGIDAIATNYFNRNVGALIFVSDGNYNVGGNPIYAAEKLNLTPIFTLGIGDTVAKKDHFIRNTVYNDVVFLKNKFPIEVDIEANRLQNKTTRLSLWQSGKMLDATTINYSNEKHQFHQHTFLVDATTPGFQTYKVKIDVIEGESSIKNNEQLLYVEVVDSRSSVLFLSTAPHPDISAIKSAIDQNETIESSYTLTKDMNYSAKKPDLVVWHEPGVQFDPKIQNYFNDNHIPVLYILGPNTPATISNKLNIVALSNSKNQSDEVLAGFNTAFSTFELSESCKQAIDFFPPLVSKFGSVRAINPTDILLFQRIGSVTKTDPLFFFGKNTQQNYGVIYGEGIWKWKLNDFIRSGTHDNFNELINKSINYLLLKRQGEGLSVSFPKRFTKEEPVIVSASFYNASLEPISTPIVSMVMKNEKGTTFKSQFGVVGTNYKLNAGKLAPGKYSWQVSTVYKGKTYSKSGYFIVDDIQLEQNNSSANHSTLKQLSIQSNGKYRFLKDYEKTLSEIAARNDITAVEYEEKVFLSLIDLAWLITLLLILLSLEWFTRRYMGTY
jgi:hypothetical protein